MKEFIEWTMTLDTTAISAAIVGLITTYGGTLVVLVIGILKSRIKNTSFKEAIEKAKLENSQDLNLKITETQNLLVSILTGIQEDIMAKENASQQERLAALKALTNDVQTASVELEQMSTAPKDINDILDELE